MLPRRLAAVRAVLDLGLRPVPHLSARRVAAAAELERYLDVLAALRMLRQEFVGAVAPEPIRSKYLGGSVAHYFSKGSQNPVAL